MDEIRVFQFLSDAVEVFDEEVTRPEWADWAYFKDEVGLLDAPAPFRVVKYDTTETHTKECPEYDHDCWSQGCGRSWSTDGQFGTLLRDANGVVWRDVGSAVKGGIGF